ncbi:MAG TPA: hypothetical protein VF952_08960 [Chloroflexia bacterium]|jgi:hypothetical protein
MKMKMKRHSSVSSFRPLVALVTLALVATVTFAAPGARQAHAQMGGDVYASADLTPGGAETNPNGAASGATFEHTSSGGTRVTISLVGLRPNTEYAAHIHDGSCAGDTLYGLEAVRTDATGTGLSTSEVAAEVEFGRWYVDLHPEGGAGEAGHAGADTLCGLVTPALAGAPLAPGALGGPGMGENAPGMPRTGSAPGSMPAPSIESLLLISFVVALAGALLVLAARRRVDKLHRHNG